VLEVLAVMHFVKSRVPSAELKINQPELHRGIHDVQSLKRDETYVVKTKSYSASQVVPPHPKSATSCLSAPRLLYSPRRFRLPSTPSMYALRAPGKDERQK
jgi:hypothetical protein